MAETRTQESDLTTFLAEATNGRTIAVSKPGDVIFAQGEPANAVFYIQSGKVKLTVKSNAGKEGVIGILGPGAFLGEGCLTMQTCRMATAKAMSDCSILRLEKATAVAALRNKPAFVAFLLSFVLTRSIRMEEDLADQMFNCTEKRLARTLLVLANFGKEGQSNKAVATISQETLAEMVGTSRSRVSFFMNKFRKLGFIQYNGTLEVHSSLINVLLKD